MKKKIGDGIIGSCTEKTRFMNKQELPISMPKAKINSQRLLMNFVGYAANSGQFRSGLQQAQQVSQALL